MARSKHGNNKNGPSRVRYHSSGRVWVNKARRILKNNGAVFLAQWKREQKVP